MEYRIEKINVTGPGSGKLDKESTAGVDPDGTDGSGHGIETELHADCGAADSGEAFAELCPGLACCIRASGADVSVALGYSDYPYIIRFGRSECSEECGGGLAVLIAGVISEIGPMAYGKGRRDAKNAMFDAV